MVFLRPKILVDSESVSQISTEKYNFIKAEQLLKQQSKLIDLTKDKQMSDIPNDAKAERLSILPYDFVKQNNIFGIDNNGEIKIYSTSELSFDIHQELLRYIGKSFEVEICNGEELNLSLIHI